MKPANALLTVLLLAAGSGLVQSWLIMHATLPAADSIGFVGMAQSLARLGLPAVFHSDPSPPVFPLLVWATHATLSQLGCIAATSWGTAAQIAAALPLSLAIGVSWLFFRHSVPNSAAILAAALACVLTVVARLGADALSDSTHLALLTLGLWAIAAALEKLVARKHSLLPACGCLASAGLALGCAQLTRVEAAAVMPALVVSLAIEAFVAKRISKPKALLATASVAAGWAVVIGLYLAACQPTSPTDAVARLWGRRGPTERVPLNVPPGNPIALAAASKPDWRLADGQPMAFGRKDTSTSSRFRGPIAALAEFAREMAQSLNYVLGPLALAGLWFSRSWIRRPIDLFLTLLVLVYVGCVLGLAFTQGYLAGRHVLLLAWLALPWAGVGIQQLGGRLADRLAARRQLTPAARLRISATLGLSLAVGGGCLFTTLVPLHASHAGHRHAVEWLATEADDGAVLDSAGYTALYSGRKTYRYAAAVDALRDPDLAYLVIEHGELMAPTTRGATMRELLGHYAEPAAIFAPPEGRGAARTVLVFRWRPWEFAHYLRGNHAR